MDAKTRGPSECGVHFGFIIYECSGGVVHHDWAVCCWANYHQTAERGAHLTQRLAGSLST